jgi:hypothetical protein
VQPGGPLDAPIKRLPPATSSAVQETTTATQTNRPLLNAQASTDGVGAGQSLHIDLGATVKGLNNPSFTFEPPMVWGSGFKIDVWKGIISGIPTDADCGLVVNGEPLTMTIVAEDATGRRLKTTQRIRVNCGFGANHTLMKFQSHSVKFPEINLIPTKPPENPRYQLHFLKSFETLEKPIEPSNMFYHSRQVLVRPLHMHTGKGGPKVREKTRVAVAHTRRRMSLGLSAQSLIGLPCPTALRSGGRSTWTFLQAFALRVRGQMVTVMGS